MRASLDTNVIIHFYRAQRQEVLFEVFDEGVFIYEQIRYIELEHHAKDLLEKIDLDILSGKIELYTDQKLKELAVLNLFEINVVENRNLYGSGDLGEVYAISLAQTLGVFSLVTDDTKQGGPYMSLLQFDDSVMPFNFSDVNLINDISNLNWRFRTQVAKFVKRFYQYSYRVEDTRWIKKLAADHNIRVKNKLTVLNRLI